MRSSAVAFPPVLGKAGRAELLQSLGRLVRGLSTLFWGLPLTFIAEVETARTDWFGTVGLWAGMSAVILNLGLLYGLAQLRPFQKQERVWQRALMRAEILALINAGLTPFIFWWHRFPANAYFLLTMFLLALSNLLFLMQLNRIMTRLTAIIPDESLRAETSVFGSLNIWLLAAVFLVLSGWFSAWTLVGASAPAHHWLTMLRLRGLGIVLFMALMPLALTMALLWKIKEVLFAGVFNHDR